MKTKILILKATIFCSAFIAQSQNRDPFAKPGWAKSKSSSTSPGGGKTNPSGPTPVAPPSIQERIEYYKRLRQMAVQTNRPIPKVTTVLTLDEIAVTGIFKTPRGYAAMVEAKPLKLSYTIYPGDKFFDGQLVAVEENKLIFRKITKLNNGKLVASEETKPLRQYTVEQELSGTAPVEITAKTEKASGEITVTPSSSENENKSLPKKIVSPLEEMNTNKTENSTGSDEKKSSEKKQTKKKQ